MKSKKTKLLALFTCIVIVVLLAVVVANINKETGKNKSDDSEENQSELQHDVDIMDDEGVVEEEDGNWTINEDSGNASSGKDETKTEENSQGASGESIQPSDDEINTPSEPGEEPFGNEDVENDSTEYLDENVLPLQPLS